MNKQDIQIRTFRSSSFLAGILIAFAGVLSLHAPSKPLGAFFFAVGLISVILLKANLYTGKVAYATKGTIPYLFAMLIWNLIGAALVAFLYRAAYGAVDVSARLAKTPLQFLLGAIITGACVFIAVEGFKRSNSLIAVVLPVAAFVACGFDHCIADAFYFAASDVTWKGLAYLLISVVGNTIGAVGVRILTPKE